MDKEDKIWNQLFNYAVVVSFIVIIEFGIILLEIGIIDDLKATANVYKSDSNLCSGQLDSLTQELERMQNDYNG